MSARILAPVLLAALSACASDDVFDMSEPDFSADLADMMSANGCVASAEEIVDFAHGAGRSDQEVDLAMDALERDGVASQRRDGRFELHGHGDCI